MNEIENSSPMRMTMAAPRPMMRARSRCSAGSLPAMIEMKMTLSMPRTISSAVSVSSATQVSGLVRNSIGAESYLEVGKRRGGDRLRLLLQEFPMAVTWSLRRPSPSSSKSWASCRRPCCLVPCHPSASPLVLGIDDTNANWRRRAGDNFGNANRGRRDCSRAGGAMPASARV